MGLETPVFISDLVPTNPPTTDVVAQGDDHIRNLKTALQGSLPNSSRAHYFPRAVAKTANYTILAADMEKIITGDATAGAFNLTLPTLAAGDDGWRVLVQKIDASANAVTIVGTINGAANLAVSERYRGVLLIWTGTTWQAFVLPVIPLALTDLSIVGGTALTAPASNDVLGIYDLSATANRKITLSDFLKVIASLTAETAVAVGDIVLLYDLSAADVRAMTTANLMKARTMSTQQQFLSGSGNYVTPAGCRQIRVRMVGGGGGGGAAVTNNGTSGTLSSFNSIVANPGLFGSRGNSANEGGAGDGGVSGAGVATLRIKGSAGQCGASDVGGTGGPSHFGGSGLGGSSATGAGQPAAVNSGSGGGGAGGGASQGAGGGGASEYVEILMNNPAATIPYVVGTKGIGGAAGSVVGGDGGDGLIIVDEYY